MTKPLKLALLLTDVLFLGYWLLAAADLLQVINIPPEYLYRDHDQIRVVAWNWSFLSIDVAFSLIGLSAVRLAKSGDPIWRPMALISLVLTFCAGIMAIGYWSILGEFDPTWFIPNFILMVWPMVFIPGLVREISGLTQSQ